jgi:MFS family permease
MSLLTPLARVWARERFVSYFMLLALASGTTISMAQLATTLYALKLGASTAQIGVISSMESLGMVFMTLPAGFLGARYGARRVYFIASAGPMLLNFVLPWTSIWYAIALTQWLIGLCIPFRIVSMNGALLAQLRQIGFARAGWYRAFMSIGMGMLGPWLATWLIGAHGYGASFVVAGSCFAAMALFSRTVMDDAAPAAVKRAADWRAGLAHLRALTGFAGIRESLAVEALSSAT